MFFVTSNKNNMVITVERTKEVLWRMGITPSYKGYKEALIAISLIQEDEDRLTALVKYIYMDVADTLGKTWTSVEHNLRTVVEKAWLRNPSYLQQIAQYSMDQKPEVGEFLSIIYTYVERQKNKLMVE